MFICRIFNCFAHLTQKYQKEKWTALILHNLIIFNESLSYFCILNLRIGVSYESFNINN